MGSSPSKRPNSTQPPVSPTPGTDFTEIANALLEAKDESELLDILGSSQHWGAYIRGITGLCVACSDHDPSVLTPVRVCLADGKVEPYERSDRDQTWVTMLSSAGRTTTPSSFGAPEDLVQAGKFFGKPPQRVHIVPGGKEWRLALAFALNDKGELTSPSSLNAVQSILKIAARFRLLFLSKGSAARSPGPLVRGESLLMSTASRPLQGSELMSSKSKVHSRQTSVAQLVESKEGSFENIAVVSTNRTGNILEWDAAAELLFGYTALEAIGMDVTMLMPEPFHSTHSKFMQSYEPGNPHNKMVGKYQVLPVVHKDGSKLDMAISVAQLDSGEQMRFMATFRAVSETTKEAPAGTAQAVKTGNATVLMTSDSRIVFFNAGAEAMFGWESAEVVNKSVDVLMPSSIAAKHASHIERAVRDPAAMNREKRIVTGKRKDGTEFPMVISVGTVQQADRLLLVASMQDISQHAEKIQLQLENEALKVEIRKMHGADKTDEFIQTPLDAVMDSLRQVLASLMLGAEDRQRVESAVVTLSSQRTKLLTPQILDSSDQKLHPTTKQWLFSQMGLAQRPTRKTSSLSAASSDSSPRLNSSDLSRRTSHRAPMTAMVVEGTEELTQLLAQGDNSLDLFEIDRISGGHSLTVTAFYVLDALDLITKLKLDTDKLIKFIGAVEQGYVASNPYHNAVHAADVTFTCYWLLHQTTALAALDDLEAFALVFACMIHDMDHPGSNQAFQVNSRSDLATLYNDRSVLENHHVACAFRTLMKEEYNFLSMDLAQYKEWRWLVIELVLATDMTRHLSFVADAKAFLETTTSRADVVSDTTLITKTFVKLADLGHTCKSIPVHVKWSELITEEFYRQGDLEKQRGLPVSPFCDRVKDDITQSQIGFFNFVIIPFVSTATAILELPGVIGEIATTNSEYWNQKKREAEEET